MENWFYDAPTRTILDENHLSVARDVNATDAAVILAALRGPKGRLAEIIADMLAWEAGQFDGDPDMPLDVSGADLVDAFTVWRDQLKAAACEPLGAASVVETAADEIEELAMLREIARLAMAALDHMKATKAGLDVRGALGDALTAYNGAPLGFRGRLNPDAADYAEARAAAGLGPA